MGLFLCLSRISLGWYCLKNVKSRGLGKIYKGGWPYREDRVLYKKGCSNLLYAINHPLAEFVMTTWVQNFWHECLRSLTAPLKTTISFKFVPKHTEKEHFLLARDLHGDRFLLHISIVVSHTLSLHTGVSSMAIISAFSSHFHFI